MREIAGIREGQRVPPPPTDTAQREREEKLYRARAETLADLTPRDLDAVTAGPDIVYRDPLVPLYREKRLGHVLLRYAVSATRDKKRVSDLSPIVSIVPRVPPDQPRRLVPTVEENRVCLDWWPPAAMLDGSTPARRRGLRGLPAGRVRRGVRRQAARRRDRRDDVRGRDGAPGPRVRLHRARGARRRGSAHPGPGRGPGSRLDPGRVRPSRAPEGVLALGEGGGTRLVWNPSLAPDLAFYRVYRLDGGERTRLADGLKDPLWFDAGASGRTYGVTAVDKAGNESPIGTAK